MMVWARFKHATTKQAVAMYRQTNETSIFIWIPAPGPLLYFSHIFVCVTHYDTKIVTKWLLFCYTCTTYVQNVGVIDYWLTDITTYRFVAVKNIISIFCWWTRDVYLHKFQVPLSMRLHTHNSFTPKNHKSQHYNFGLSALHLRPLGLQPNKSKLTVPGNTLPHSNATMRHTMGWIFCAYCWPTVL